MARIGSRALDPVGFHNKAATIQRAAAAQAAITGVSTNGAAAAAADLPALKAEAELIGDDVRACIVLLNEIRTVLVNKGLMKGAA